LYSFLLVVIISLCARIFPSVIWQDVHNQKFGKFYYCDSYDYDRLAWDLTEGKGYTYQGRPTSLRAPGLPFFLSGIYKIWGHDVELARNIILVLGILIPVLLTGIAIRMYNVWIGTIAGITAAISPDLIFYSHFVMTETLCAFTLLCAFYCLFAHRKTHWKSIFVGGVFLGLTMLVRAFFMVMPFFIAVYFLLEKQEDNTWKKRISKITVLMIATGMVVLPWTYRNYRVHKALVPISTQTGTVLYLSYLPSEGRFGEGYVQDGDLKNIWLASENEVEFNKASVQFTLKWIQVNSGKLWKLEFLKTLWFFYPYEGRRYGLLTPFDPVFGGVLLLFITALFYRKTYDYPGRPSLMILGYTFFFCMIFYAMPRFRMPILPFMILPASASLYHLCANWSKKRSRIILAVICVCIVTGMLSASWVVETF